MSHIHSPGRRAAILAGLIGALFGRAAAHAAPAGQNPDGIASQLFERAQRANAAFVRGDMKTWLRHAGPIARDFTLMQPFGGPTTHGFDTRDAHLAEIGAGFRNGVAHSELEASYVSDALAVLVFIERQAIEVEGLPSQDWSLRVTQVYRRRGDEWEFAHRHADLMVRHISLATAAALARGDAA